MSWPVFAEVGKAIGKLDAADWARKTLATSAMQSVQEAVANPTLPSNYLWDIDFTAGGEYVAIVGNATPYVTIGKRAGEAYSKLTNPATLPTGIGRCVAFSLDGVYLAVAHDTAPRLTIYKRTGDTFAKLANPTTLPSGEPRAIAMSGDGTYLFIDNGGFSVMMYKRTGDVFAHVRNINIGVLINRLAVYSTTSLAIAAFGSPYILVYDIVADNLVPGAVPNVLPTNQATGVSFSHNGNLLAASHYGAPYLSVFKKNGTVFEKLPNPDVIPLGNGTGVCFGGENRLAVASYGGLNLLLYEVEGEILTALSHGITGGGGGVVALSADAALLGYLQNDASPYVTMRLTDITQPFAYTHLSVVGSGYLLGVSLPTGDCKILIDHKAYTVDALNVSAGPIRFNSRLQVSSKTAPNYKKDTVWAVVD